MQDDSFKTFLSKQVGVTRETRVAGTLQPDKNVGLFIEEISDLITWLQLLPDREASIYAISFLQKWALRQPIYDSVRKERLFGNIETVKVGKGEFNLLFKYLGDNREFLLSGEESMTALLKVLYKINPEKTVSSPLPKDIKEMLYGVLR